MINTLHILTKNNIPSELCNDAVVVLINEASYLLLQPISFKSLYVLKNDVLARGLKAPNAVLIDYNELVSLTTKYQKVITWA